MRQPVVVFAAAVAGLILISASWAFATTVLPGGCDCWTTSPGTQFGLPAIPANFFGPGSDPITAGSPASIVLMQGDKLPDATIQKSCPKAVTVKITWLSPHGGPADASKRHAIKQEETITDPIDTIACRMINTVFSKVGDTQTGPTEMVALSLASIQPLHVSFNGGTSFQDWNVHVDLDGLQAQGTNEYTLTEEAWKMGTLRIASLPVGFAITFTSVTNPSNTKLMPGLSFTISGTQGTFNSVMTPALNAWGMLLLTVFLIVATVIILVRRGHRTVESVS